MMKNIPNLINEIKPQILEAVGLEQYKYKEYCAKAHQNKMEKTVDKEKILKVARWKRCTGIPWRYNGFRAIPSQ